MQKAFQNQVKQPQVVNYFQKKKKKVCNMFKFNKDRVIVNFEHISHLALVFLLLTLNM